MTHSNEQRLPAAVDLDELASRLRTAITRLAFHLRRPATLNGVTPTRLAALSILAATGPRRPGDLAHDLGLSAPGMSGLTRTLIETGWVERKPDPDDHRAYLLRLTPDGASALRQFRQQGAGKLAEDVAALSAEQQAALRAALPVLETLLNRYAIPESRPGIPASATTTTLSRADATAAR